MIGAFLAIALLSAGAEDLNLAAANESLDKAKIRHENVELLLREANVDILRGSQQFPALTYTPHNKYGHNYLSQMHLRF